MKTLRPPKLAVALLDRFVHDNEPLAGDLLEAFAAKRSRLWFWRQVLLAIVIQRMRPPIPERPLGLLKDPPIDRSDRPLTASFRRRRISLTGSGVPDVGGLTLVALGVIVATERPNAWLIFVPAVLGGIVLGALMVVVRRPERSRFDPSAPRSFFGRAA